MNVSGAVSGCAFVPGPSGTRRPGPNLTFGEVTTCTFPRPSLTLNGVVEVIVTTFWPAASRTRTWETGAAPIVVPVK